MFCIVYMTMQLYHDVLETWHVRLRVVGKTYHLYDGDCSISQVLHPAPASMGLLNLNDHGATKC